MPFCSSFLSSAASTSLRQSLRQLLLLTSLALTAPLVLANGHGGGEGPAGPAPIQVTVNIGPQGSGNVLQASLVLHTASEEANKEIELYRPMVVHYVNLVINSFSIDAVRAVRGKDKLVDAIMERINKELGLNPKNGIDDVFFTSFIVQGG